MPLKHNFFYFLLLLVVFLGISIFWLQQKNFKQSAKTYSHVISPTLAQATYEVKNQSQIVNGTRTYVSKEYSYSFSYPYDWQVLNEPNVQGIEIQKIDKSGFGFSISIRINDNTQKLSLENYAKSQAFTLPNGSKDVPQKITVGNRQGYKLQELPQGLITTIYLPYTRDKVVYIFAGGEFDKSAQTHASYSQIVDNFLTSLKFY